MDMMELADRLKETADDIEFVFFAQDPSVDVLLILNACEAACADRPQFPGPVIVVTPETVDHWPVNKINLIKTITERIRYCN